MRQEFGDMLEYGELHGNDSRKRVCELGGKDFPSPCFGVVFLVMKRVHDIWNAEKAAECKYRARNK